jgi:hypothetical protein
MDRKQHLNIDKIIIQYLKKKIDISIFVGILKMLQPYLNQIQYTLIISCLCVCFLRRNNLTKENLRRKLPPF